MIKMKRLTISSVDEGMTQTGTLVLLDRSVNWFRHLAKVLGTLTKTTYTGLAQIMPLFITKS